MREHKYRAWDKENRGWLHDFRISPFGKVMVAHKGKTDKWEYSTELKLNIILLEFTGLKDKNGKEIYEGDILKRIDKYPSWGVSCKVVWNRNGWYLQKLDKMGYMFEIYLENESEIIGNIYENPELFET